MKELTLLEIAKACNGRLTQPQCENILINSITTDSRKAGENCLFVPLKGERADGHDFILQTFKSGAVCSLSEKKLKPINLLL